MSENRPIEDSHEQILRHVLNIDEAQELPPNIVDLYWDTVRTCRKIGFTVTERELLIILLLSNRAVQSAPVTFLDAVKAGVPTDALVLAKFRNQWRWGSYKRVVNKHVVVQLHDDTGEERDFAPTSVRLPTAEELKTLPA